MEHFVTTGRDKAHGRKLGTQIGSEIMVFAIFLDIAQDCSLGQCLTSSRAETSKKKKKKKIGAKIGAKMVFSILMSTQTCLFLY